MTARSCCQPGTWSRFLIQRADHHVPEAARPDPAAPLHRRRPAVGPVRAALAGPHRLDEPVQHAALGTPVRQLAQRPPSPEEQHRNLPGSLTLIAENTGHPRQAPGIPALTNYLIAAMTYHPTGGDAGAIAPSRRTTWHWTTSRSSGGCTSSPRTWTWPRGLRLHRGWHLYR